MALYLGLMSGTSLDGIDVVVVEFRGEGEVPESARPLAFRTTAYDADFRERLAAACRAGSSRELCELNFELGRRFAGAVRATLAASELRSGAITAVGSAGQTFWHAPPEEGRSGSTLQLGEPALIAEETGIPIVADFRVRDVAAGGHGAPIAPYFDRLLLASPDRARAIQNIGGMGNVTALPAAGAGASPVAFDTGPGMALIDAAVERLTEGGARYDPEGSWAAQGEVLPGPLESWLDDPFFRTPPPRSTGRERFGPERLERWLERNADADRDDLLATLTELTARSIAWSYRWIDFEPDEVYLCGGGARNRELVRRLRAHLDPRPVHDLSELGWDGDAREAAAVALLARQHRLGHAADVSWSTGAAGPRVLGKWIPAGAAS